MGHTKDLTDQKFGRLTALREAGVDKQGRKRWLCRCVCGKKKVVASRHLVQGKTETCGCLTGRRPPAKTCLGKTGKKHPRWKGGRIRMGGAYVGVWVAPYTYTLEHRLKTGAPQGMDVHHINGNGKDNRLSNLVVVPRSKHMLIHKALDRKKKK